MTTNTNNYSVKELVAKYRNYVLENAPKYFSEEDIKKVTDINIKINDIIFKKPLKKEDEDPDCQLLFSLYLSVADISSEKASYFLDKYAKCFYKDALTEDE